MVRHNRRMLKTLLGRLASPTSVAIPDALWSSTLAALPCVADLTAEETARLRGLAGRLLAEKEMSAAGDLELTADMQVNIAVQACLPILNLGFEWYRGWSSIVVYPGEFLVPRSVADEDGVDPDSEAADPYYAHLPFDPYAAHDEGEFFAVTSESFFVAPEALQRAFPQWYALLAAFFRQDPAARRRP